MKLIVKWAMPFKEKIKYVLALFLAILVCIIGIVLSVVVFDKNVSAIIICAVIIFLCLLFIMILCNRRTLIYDTKVVYYNMFGLKKEIYGNINDIFILIHNDKHNKIYLTVKYKNKEEKLNCRIIYNEILREELRRNKINHDVMLSK